MATAFGYRLIILKTVASKERLTSAVNALSSQVNSGAFAPQSMHVATEGYRLVEGSHVV